jgi:hypothetical protein
MSHVSKIEINVQDLGLLKKACAELGLELVEQKRYRWYGRSVGDYALPEGFTVKDLGSCNYAIRVPGNAKAYEVGVVKRRDGIKGYELLVDEWNDGYGLIEKIGPGAAKLKQAYSVQVAKRWGQKNGYLVTVTKSASGKQVVTARRG